MPRVPSGNVVHDMEFSFLHCWLFPRISDITRSGQTSICTTERGICNCDTRAKILPGLAGVRVTTRWTRAASGMPMIDLLWAGTGDITIWVKYEPCGAQDLNVTLGA